MENRPKHILLAEDDRSLLTEPAACTLANTFTPLEALELALVLTVWSVPYRFIAPLSTTSDRTDCSGRGQARPYVIGQGAGWQVQFWASMIISVLVGSSV